MCHLVQPIGSDTLRAAVPGQLSGAGGAWPGLSTGAASTEGTTAEGGVMVTVQLWGLWSCPPVQAGLLCSAECFRDPGKLTAVVGDGDGASSLPRLGYGLRSQVCSSSWCKAAIAVLHQEASVKILVHK